MNTIFSRGFWRQAIERAVKSGAQAVVGVISQDAFGADVFAANWQNAVGFGLGAVGLSILTSIGSSKVTGGSRTWRPDQWRICAAHASTSTRPSALPSPCR